jgi:hypothetical protein
MELLIYNHPIDDSLSIGKCGNLLQASGVGMLWWSDFRRKFVAVGHVHSWNCTKAEDVMNNGFLSEDFHSTFGQRMKNIYENHPVSSARHKR